MIIYSLTLILFRLLTNKNNIKFLFGSNDLMIVQASILLSGQVPAKR